MKKILFVLVMFLMSISMEAQSVVKTEDGKYPAYCTVSGYNFWGFGKVKVKLDLGDSEAKEDQSLFDESGKKIKFNTMMEVLDYMGKRGWFVNGTYYITKGSGQNVINYLLEKKITNDSEKTEGLTLREDKD
ncbi:MAG: hypothetical protein LKE54_03660 [Prevotella sp.]|jgi:hypothetical protein|nr:hypothetical protein [Prevotella sp.]MCH3994143.1 hypothetical protein [Prevotella sp.]